MKPGSVKIGLNGSSTVYRLTTGKDHDGLDAEALVSHEVDERFQVPVNIMIVDAGGNAVRVMMGHDRTIAPLQHTEGADVARSSGSVGQNPCAALGGTRLKGLVPASTALITQGPIK